ncbi:DUF2914 domain-containing protein [Brumimicrobium mesophilum]|uniref:DUF2914 domain-containing protein n=1 Tax=Brumimicrobium mesophilum TaxID=392717 RepID=UPI000D140774|nr:DUF2914 domain-containing protein [Brumimicrobium mesophilum]
MSRVIEKYKKSRFRKFVRRNSKYAPVIFFVGGFIFDTLTLGRIDRLYDITVLSLYMFLLTISLYLYNRVGDRRWRNTFFEPYQLYLPLAIQFFFGGLSSAYVIYFSRSVSLSKTIAFFVILLVLLFANELLKKRISNKYLQFSVYFFVSFTFFTFMIPVFIKQMNTTVFLISGLVSLITTLTLITIIYRKSPSTRLEIRIRKLITIILVMYGTINLFYFTNLIPPVPLALEAGIVAHNVERKNGDFLVTYERDDWFVFWRDHRIKYIHQENESVFVFTSIFAPTKISKAIFHRWQWFNETSKEWEVVDNISYRITGGRDDGFRGYTYKNNIKPGFWRVDVVTKENLVLGIIDFEIIMDVEKEPKRMVERSF